MNHYVLLFFALHIFNHIQRVYIIKFNFFPKFNPYQNYLLQPPIRVQKEYTL